MSKAYYNTTPVSDDAAKQFEEIAEGQNKFVLECFKSTGQVLSPSQVYRKLLENGDIDISTPLTSIRRSITNLTNKGLLVKTQTRLIGNYGRPENCWSYESKKK